VARPNRIRIGCNGKPEARAFADGRFVADSPVIGRFSMLHISPLAYYAPASLADPAGSSVLIAAVDWLQGTLLGTIATTAAIIAVASVGFMMLSGRVNVRYGLTVIAGSFVLFGAASIAAGIQALAMGGAALAAAPAPPPPPLEIPPPPPAPPPGNRDPYAGASVPAQ
jgi:type IV secretory pathway VirB2 component (pilin)